MISWQAARCDAVRMQCTRHAMPPAQLGHTLEWHGTEPQGMSICQARVSSAATLTNRVRALEKASAAGRRVATLHALPFAGSMTRNSAHDDKPGFDQT
jgi:hypothetical protein